LPSVAIDGGDAGEAARGLESDAMSYRERGAYTSSRASTRSGSRWNALKHTGQPQNGCPLVLNRHHHCDGLLRQTGGTDDVEELDPGALRLDRMKLTPHGRVLRSTDVRGDLVERSLIRGTALTVSINERLSGQRGFM
jgi:hypothetical protein